MSPQHQRAQVSQKARTAQREIEKAVRDAVAKGQLKGNAPLLAKAVVTVWGIDLKFEIDGDIELGENVPA